ncbi:cell division protein FtsQ/DivIB [Pseudarthrobacter sp. IC2-21]|uniref:cell division protein FtsQ/DivIB n=1 Tax=Pseudarthrobacter sp. IC2-21 TaxID=3092262 RepID=UPI002A6A712B|nr:cell division protein FtsQ/DivIB [Pseudarthrobacter sp. IC2-21]
MGSPRRPTYASPGRRPADAGAASAEPETISASKSVPVPDPATVPARKKGKAPGSVPSREKKPAGPDNVLVFPEPPAKRRRRHLLVAAGTVLGLVAALLAAAIFSPMLAVGTISVTGTKLVTSDQVQAALEPLKGKPLPQISDDEVSSMLKSLVQIKSVSSQARPPSELVVHVLERTPVALVKQGEQYQLVDVDGVVLAATTDPASVSLPVIDGGAGTIGKDLFQATAEVLGALPPDVLSKLSNASAQSVDAVELKLVDGQTIIWGNAGEKELKAKVLAALLKVPADPKNPVRVYDVSAPRHPVTR